MANYYILWHDIGSDGHNLATVNVVTTSEITSTLTYSNSKRIAVHKQPSKTTTMLLQVWRLDMFQTLSFNKHVFLRKHLNCFSSIFQGWASEEGQCLLPYTTGTQCLKSRVQNWRMCLQGETCWRMAAGKRTHLNFEVLVPKQLQI